MAININTDNMLYRNEATIEQFNNAYNATNEFKVFDICRVYKSGQVKAFGSNASMLETHYSNNLQSADDLNGASATLRDHKKQNNNLNYHLLLPQNTAHKSRELLKHYQIRHILTISIQHEDYIDMIGFHHPASTQAAVTDYINNLSTISQIAHLLREEAAPLFSSNDDDFIEFEPAIKHLIHQYFEEQDRQKKQNDKPLTVLWKVFCEKYSISRRESDCMMLMLNGYNTKQIAEKLFISTRTVECHALKLRQKTKTASRSQLIDRYNYLNNH